MKKYIFLIITTLLSVILGVFYIDAFLSIDHSINSTSTLLLVMLLIVLGVLIIAFLYDVGHLLFTKMAGYKIVSYKILNTDFYRINGKVYSSNNPIKDHLNKIVIASENPNNNYVFYYLGGVFFNLIVGCIFAIIIMFANASGISFLLLVTFGFGNIVYAFINLVPISFFYNDGYYYYSLLKDKVALQAFHHKNTMIYYIANGKNLDELNFTSYRIDNLNNDYNDPIILELKELETYYYLYRFQFKEALDTINYVFSKSDKMLNLYKKSFTNLKIVCLTMCEKNDEALNLYLSLSRKHKDYISKCKTIDDALAALCMHLKIELNNEQALVDYDRCKRFSESTPFIGERQPILDLIKLIMNK